MKANPLFVGLDPSSGETNSSGIAILDEAGVVIYLGLWKTFRELAEILNSFTDRILTIAIDGPLQPPAELDFCCFSDWTASCQHQQTTPYKGRYAEYLLNRNGFKCFTSSRQSFARQWIRRCFELNKYLMGLDYRTIEVYPTAVRKMLFPDILGSKKLLRNRKRLQEELNKAGLTIPRSTRVYTDHELDAVLAAYTALLEHKGASIKVGNKEDGYIILPKTESEFRT